jgi:hypothetical protein
MNEIGILTGLLFSALMLVGNVGWGQTNPTAHNLSSSNFSFTTQTATNTAYPTSMQGWTTGTNNIATLTTAAPAGNQALVASGSATTAGLSNLGASGFNFLSTGSSPNRQVGALCVAVNASGREAIKVSWTVDDQTTGSTRQMNITLQYRLGTSGIFTTVASTTYTTSNSSDKAEETFTNIALPAECDDEPVVQIRWITYESASQSGGRDAIRLDEIAVSSIPATPTITSISPSSATEGGAGFILTVNGTNFISGVSTVRWNGSDRTTTFVSATELTANISAADVASQGTASVTVLNTGNATASNAQTFTINAAGSCTAPTVANTSATSVGATVATLNGEVTGLGSTATELSARGVEYADDSSLSPSTISSSPTPPFAVGTFSRGLTGLNANTQYWYRGYATNDCASPLTGYSHTSGFPTFTTQHNAPTVQPESNVTAGSFQANWQVNNSNSAGSATFTYTLEYSTTSGFSGGTVTGVGSIASGTTSYNVTGLSAGTPYWYRVRINNAGGNSNYSAIEPVVTLNTITTGTVSNSPFCVSANGTATGTVAFTSVGTFSSNTYSVELSNSSGVFSGTMIGSSLSDLNSGTINVTIPANTPTGAGYRMRVISNSPATTGAQSAAFTVNLGPANVTASGATNGNAQSVVSWTNPTTCFDDIMIVAKASAFTAAVPTGTAYVHSSNSFTNGSNSTFDGGVVVYKGSASPQTITGLTNGTTYTFKIYSRKNNDWSAGVTTTATPVAPPLWTNPITGTNPNADNPYTIGDLVGSANVTVSGIGRGSGIAGTNANNRYNANGWVSGALGTDDYFYFTLTPDPGYAISFTNFIFTGQASSGSASVSLRSSLDSYAGDIGSPVFTGSTVDLSGSSYQNVSSAITFRLYGYSIASGTYSINDFTFNGTVSAALPTVNLSVNPTSGSENTPGTDITLTATASAAVIGDQTITIGLTGTAVAADFQSTPPTTITIASGQTIGNSTTFRVLDDVLNEGTQTATFTITATGPSTNIGTTPSVNFAITDNDVPLISTVGTLNAFSTNVGTAATSQSFTVSGDNLTGNLSVNAPAGYEVSLSSGSGYTTGALSVPVSGGDVAGEPRIIYVRLTGASTGSFSGNVAISGGSATTVNVAATGTVIDPNAAADLFISEYGEGSSGASKYLEIFNKTGGSVDLSNYRIELINNGGIWQSNGGTEGFLTLSGTLANNDVFVISNNSGDVSGGDLVTIQANWNGDDAVGLAKNTSGTWAIIDLVGTDGADPGAGWNVAGVANGTLDNQLVRKSSVCGPNANWTSSAGTTTGNSEWIVTPYVTGAPATLGSHVGCTLTLPTVQVSLSSSAGSESTSTTDIVLTVTASAAVSGNQTVKVALTGTNVTTGDLTGFSSPVTVTILNGQTTGTATFRVADDALTEASETAIFTLFDRSSGIELGTTISANLTITDNDVPTSTASVIQTQNGETLAISSLLTGSPVTTSNGVQVWRFRLYDGDGSSSDADGLPTIYTNWTITPSASNTVPDWDAVIQDRKFFLDSDNSVISGGGITNPASILFPVASPFITVPDNGFVDVYMRITLKSTLPVGSDGKRFGFQITNGNVTVASSSTSSQLGTFTSTSSSSMNAINVTATLQFINAPNTVGLGDAFTITVSAIDINGNIDQDVTSAITLAQNSGTGTMSGGSTLNLVNGTRTWTGLSYDAVESFQVRASGGGYPNITASINVVDADYQLFDDFNRGINTNTVGTPSSESSSTYTELDYGDGSKTRIENGQLLLSNCNSGGTGGNEAMEQVMFNVENRYETVFSSAGSTMEWLFNMRQSRPDPAGFNTNNYAAGVILGSNQQNVDAAGANGYAVILGNPNEDQIRLVRFTNGMMANSSLTVIAQTADITPTSHFSVHVTFNPCNGQWSLSARNDGSSFVAPNTGSLGVVFTGTDQTHTALDLKHFGFLWNHNNSCTETASFDNVSIPNSSTALANTKTWHGNVNANWNEPNNWGPCPGVPTIANNVLIPNVTPRPVVSASPAAVCRTLTLNTGAELTINSGQNLTADNAVTNNGTIRVMNSANFIQTANSTSYTGSGSMVVQRQGSSSSTVYNYWGSPITNANVPGSNTYLYNSAVGTHSNADDTPADPGWQAYSGPMTPGRGYAATGAGLVTFTGTPNNNSVPYAVTTSAQPMTSTVPGTRFNLVANPFPSAISANLFLQANGPAATLPANRRIAGVLYFWDDDNSGSSGYTTSDYATWTTIGSVGGGGNTPQGSIASGQGFKVDAETSGNIVFTNSMRGGDNSQFFRLAEDDEFMDRLWLNISGAGNFNQTLVAFRDDATDLRDLMYDAYKVRGNAQMALGSVQANETFAVAAYPTLTTDRVVPLLTYVAQQGNYTFEADSVDGFAGFTIYLEDLLTGQLHVLQQGTTVAVQMGPEHEYGRFQLRFSPELVTGVNDAAGVMGRIIASEQGIRVMMGTDVSTTGDLLLYSLSGQLVSSRRLAVVAGTSDRLDVSGIPLGVYLAEFRSEAGVINAKVILQ